MGKVVLAGAGVMGASLAQVYAKAGYSVLLWGRQEESLEKGRALVRLNQATLVKEDMLTEDESAQLMGRIHYTCDAECFSEPDIDLVLESIVEDLNVKRAFWAKVSAVVSQDVLLASNTSGLRICDLAESVTEKSRFMGQHWLNPPHLLPLCELIVGKDTSPKTVERMKKLVLGLNKKPVVVKDINGFLINRLQFAILREALYIVESGAASMEDLDNVMKYGLGLRYAALGPFLTADLGGLDTFKHISDYLFRDLCDQKEGSQTLHRLVKEGRLGVKSGAGFYDYSNGKDKETIRQRDELFIKLAKCLYQD